MLKGSEMLAVFHCTHKSGFTIDVLSLKKLTNSQMRGEL